MNTTDDNIPSDSKNCLTTLAEPPELLLYRELQQKSHPQSLLKQLFFMMNSNLRRDAELYISQQATLSGHKALESSNLQRASDLTVANLYWYFKFRYEQIEQ